MEEFDKLTSAQTNTGKAITQLRENFRRERIERRSIANTQGFKQRLDELWENFCETHKKLEESQEINKDHAYFTQNYKAQVQGEYEAFCLKIQKRLEETDKEPSETQIDHKRNRQLDAIIGALNRIMVTVEGEITNRHSRAYYSQKLKTMNEYWTQIASLHSEIMAEYDEDTYDKRKYDEVEDHYQTMAIKLQERLDEQNNESSSVGNVKLPKITLPVFDGSYTKWKPFKDLFTQLIHNRSLSSAEKMYYLKANLSGEPNRLIKHLQATDSNYTMAWKILTDRYDNMRTIVTATLNELLSQTTLTSESALGVKRIHDTSKECLLGLQNMGIRIQEWAPILLHLLLQKLDKESRKLYEQSLKSPRELQSIEDFFKFLESRFQMLETMHVKEERRKQ